MYSLFKLIIQKGEYHIQKRYLAGDLLFIEE